METRGVSDMQQGESIIPTVTNTSHGDNHKPGVMELERFESTEQADADARANDSGADCIKILAALMRQCRLWSGKGQGRRLSLVHLMKE
ncbi:LOW QUALITY PROTEIN: hypothetical protein ACHAWU_002076 [Discostella pseudostelligera]|uniref:Uncharacterized protein n=1 Tax=Discostella pseudostelligera TaxID=259834 RepID=A0ABD3M5E9_9STRA